MAIQLKPPVTKADFEAFIHLPENTDLTFELIGGEIVEVPSNPFVSAIAAKIILFLGMYLLNNDIGHITGEAGGYIVNGEMYAPDVAYISYALQPQLAQKGYNPNPPEIAVEVISDPDGREEQANLRRKLANYLAAGVLVWVVNPHDRFVEVYTPGKSVIVLDEHGTLDGGEILPGFMLAVKDIFPKSAE